MVLAAAFPALLLAQTDSARAALGLSAIGALGIQAGASRIERDVNGLEAGAQVDLGHFGNPRIRLWSDIAFLRSMHLTERFEVEGRTYRGVFYDLSGNVGVSVLGAAPGATFTPYVGGAVGIHILSSSFGSLAIDSRYNTNNFGFLATLGVRTRIGSSGRRAMLIELRRVQAKDVSRLSLQLGLATLFNDLARR